MLCFVEAREFISCILSLSAAVHYHGKPGCASSKICPKGEGNLQLAAPHKDANLLLLQEDHPQLHQNDRQLRQNESKVKKKNKKKKN